MLHPACGTASADESDCTIDVRFYSLPLHALLYTFYNFIWVLQILFRQKRTIKECPERSESESGYCARVRGSKQGCSLLFPPLYPFFASRHICTMESPVSRVVRPLGKLCRLGNEVERATDAAFPCPLYRHCREIPLVCPCTQLLLPHHRCRTVPYFDARFIESTHS